MFESRPTQFHEVLNLKFISNIDQKMSELECLAVYVAKCLGECLAATSVENTRVLCIPPASPSSPMSIPYIPLH